MSEARKLTMVASPNPFGVTVMSMEENVEQEGSRSLEVTPENLNPGIYTAMLMLKTGDNVMMNTIRIVHNQ